MKEDIEVSIIIVHYKTLDYTIQCLKSVEQYHGNLKIETIVVNNEEEENDSLIILNSFPQTIWINSGYNAGFARANNLGIEYAKGEFIVLLNSDAVLVENTLQSCLKKFKYLETEGKNVGLLSCQVVGFDGILQYNSNFSYPSLSNLWNANSFKIFFNRIITQKNLNKKEKKHQLHSKDHESHWLGGVFIIARKSLISQKKFALDNDFFMYAEDIEWCYRLKKADYLLYFFSGTKILHENGGTANQLSEWKVGQIYISTWLAILKIYGKFYLILFLLLMRLNFWLDDILSFRKKLFGKNKEDFVNYQNRKKIRMYKKKYIRKILLDYQSTPSSAESVLKYEP